MTLHLVRHADAGDRAAWTGDDSLRPLSATGRLQAGALRDRLLDVPLARIVSSPAHRCVDTVAPLAEARDLVVEEDDALAEGAPFDLIDRLLRRCAHQDVVLCSHGDVIEAVVTTLRRQGLHLDGGTNWPKASTWVLEGWPDTTRAELVAPPHVV